jgi:hypothetical protein
MFLTTVRDASLEELFSITDTEPGLVSLFRVGWRIIQGLQIKTLGLGGSDARSCQPDTGCRH